MRVKPATTQKLGLRRPVNPLRASCRSQTSRTCRNGPVMAVYETEDGSQQQQGSFPAQLRIPTVMVGNLGSSGGGATMEKSKLSNKQVQKMSAPKLDAGGGGGMGGKGVFTGGGGGDDGSDDEDDYNENEDDNEAEDASLWWHKVPLSQLYDKASVQAVLSEWCMTIETLPTFLRLVASMQYYSTAQWVRYLTIQDRPNLFRAVERSLSRFPDARSGFVGRMLADPAFMQKTGIEGGIAFTLAMAHEVHVRGKRIGDELDYALINAACVAAASAACSALVAPSKAPTALSSKFPWQSMLNKLPNNVFEKSTPARGFELPQRLSSFVAKGVELSAISAIAGASSAGLQHCAVAARRASNPKYSPVTPVPSISRAAGGMGLYGLAATNTRMQLGAGMEQTLIEYAKRNTTWQVIGLSTAYRAVSQVLLENPWSVGPPQLVALSRSSLTGQPAHHVPTPVVVPKTRKVRKLVKKVRTPEEEDAGFQISAVAAPRARTTA